jgi:ankyrin repeat protein
MITIGSTPLLRAAKAFDVDAIKLLIEGGAVVDLPNNAGYTPVMAAAGLGSRDHDTRGRFLTEDVQTKSIEALRVLIKAGADVNARDNRGQTPVHGAAFWGWTDVVQFLADNGAKLDVKDNQGKTPLDSAMGRAGGNSRGGQRVEVFPKTGALIEKLLAQGTTPKQ